MPRTKKAKADAHQIVTDAVIKFLESGDSGKWQKPWNMLLADGNYCPATGNAYKGVINTFALNALSYASEYKSNAWGTYKQWKGLGTDESPVNVKQGAKAAYIFVPIIYTKKDGSGNAITDSSGDEMKGLSFKQVAVFNADQVDGYTEPTLELPVNQVVDSAKVDSFIANLDIDISHGGNRAYYSPVGDHIRLPVKEAFKAIGDSTATESYYGTALHECVHATGHKSRCNRDLTGNFGNTDYAFEELVAEMGAAILCNQHNVSDTPRADHAKYIASWLKGLKGDKNAVFKAAGLAGKAIKWMDKQQPTTTK